MATKEDVLEQLVEEYLIHLGFFVRHNVKFLPQPDHPDYVKRQDSNHSDIDVLGFHPLRKGVDRIWAVSCKSWQFGFNPASEIRNIAENKVVRGRDAWKSFRELVIPKWTEAYIEAVRKACGSEKLTHVLAVAKLTGDKDEWESYRPFSDALGGNPLKIITFREIIDDIHSELGTTLAASEVGRMLQMFKAAGVNL